MRIFQNVGWSLGTTVGNRNEVHGEIRRRINSGNACSIQKLVTSHILYKAVEKKIYMVMKCGVLL